MKDKEDNIKIEASEWERTVDWTERIKWIPLTWFYECGRRSYDPKKWQYLDNQRLRKDDVSMSWLRQPVKRSVTNYSAKVIADQTFS
jgi:hypothetical protein